MGFWEGVWFGLVWFYFVRCALYECGFILCVVPAFYGGLWLKFVVA